ncbi:GNAT family N-acetyltransferase [Aeromicrobium terrae]|uniref:GNAT family N-acetyltransferase n=1 Tax=Aeromicrobium terrae TaxID=2498846 RepID=A0A5C8NS16_9ACTN|nr:GNAT family N-acetyltransferase [Aeromicrobium terrae]TXL63263.1 GNAT family N-acetyltransferase [Aeromicrobium terrae]
MLRLRVATVDDLDAIVELQARCWLESYAGVVPQEKALDGGGHSRRRRWADRIVMRRRHVRVADEDGQVVGVVSWGEGATGDRRGMELKDLLVSSSHHGNGLADELLDLVPTREPVFLWVYRDSAPAREFYERAGFVSTGTTGVDVDTGVDVVLMVRED